MQEFFAVQCFQCKQFQVVQKRKDRKFSCKICGNKQSVRKIAARSNKAADVRKFVQQINLRRGEVAEQYDDIHAGSSIANQHEHLHNSEEIAENLYDNPIRSKATRGVTQFDCPNPADALRASKWSQYDAVLTKSNPASGNPVDDPEDCPEYFDNNDTDEQGFVTALPDITVLRANKKKHHSRLQAPSNLSSGSLSTEPSNDVQKPRTKRGTIVRNAPPIRPSKRSRKERTVQRMGADNGMGFGTSRWGSWGDGGVNDSCDKLGDDGGAGLLTRLGSDEVVQDDVLF